MNTINISDFNRIGGELISAWSSYDTYPDGPVIGKDGNAVLIKTSSGVSVVSRPAIDGPIGEVVVELSVDTPSVDLTWAFPMSKEETERKKRKFTMDAREKIVNAAAALFEYGAIPADLGDALEYLGEPKEGSALYKAWEAHERTLRAIERLSAALYAVETEQQRSCPTYWDGD